MTTLPPDWKWERFGDIVKDSQYGLSTPATRDALVPMLRMNNIGDGKLILSNLVRINVSKADLEKYQLKDGDLLFNRTNSGDLVGKTALFRGGGQYVCASYIVRFRLRCDQVDPRFICYAFHTENSRKTLRQLATRAVAQSNINPTALQAVLRLPVPPLPEQVAVADILECWDSGVAGLQKLLSLKQEMKRGLSQQLLSGITRFPEFRRQSWLKLTLGDIVTPKLRITKKPKTAFLAAGIRSHGKGVFLKENFEAEDIALDELFQLRTDDLVVNITFAWEGAIAIVPPEADGAFVSHRFPTFTFKPEVSFSGYFRHLVRQKRFVYEMGLASPGGAGRNRVLSKTGFLRIPVEIPSYEEQKRIAEVLDRCDCEIELLQEQLKAVRKQKCGLMQKLLTGRIRVKSVKKFR